MKIQAQVGKRILDVTIDRRNGGYEVAVDGVVHRVDAQPLEGDFYTILMGGKSYEISVEPEGDGYHVRHGGSEQTVTFADPSRSARASFVSEGPQKIVSVMPGKVVRVLVHEGQEVRAGQGLLVVEAMKMENEIASPKDGTVASVDVDPGQAVETGATLIVVD